MTLALLEARDLPSFLKATEAFEPITWDANVMWLITLVIYIITTLIGWRYHVESLKPFTRDYSEVWYQRKLIKKRKVIHTGKSFAIE